MARTTSKASKAPDGRLLRQAGGIDKPDKPAKPVAIKGGARSGNPRASNLAPSAAVARHPSSSRWSSQCCARNVVHPPHLEWANNALMADQDEWPHCASKTTLAEWAP